MAKKITALLLVIMLCLSVLTSCFIVINKDGIDKDGETDETKKNETIPPFVDVVENGKKRVTEILEENFKGVNLNSRGYTVVIGDDTESSFFTNGESSYLRAISIQSQLISDKLNCVLNINVVPYNQLLSDAQAAKNAGLFYADLICVPQKAIGHMRSQNMLYNLKDIFGDSIIGNGFDEASIVQASGNNAVYAVAGKGTVTPGAYYCVYFNKELADKQGLTAQIYNSLEENNWTFEKMLSFGELTASYNPDCITISGSDVGYFGEAMFGASGMNYIDTSISSVPKLMDNGTAFTDFINKVRPVATDASISNFYENARYLFETGKILFYIDTLDKAAEITGAYGVMPMPKLDASQESYYTPANENAKVYAVLNTNTDTENLLLIMKAINDTADIVHDAMARDLLDYAFRDSMSYSTAKFIFKNAKYDFAYMYGDQYQAIADSTYNAVRKTFSVFDDYKKLVNAQTVQFNKDIAGLFP